MIAVLGPEPQEVAFAVEPLDRVGLWIISFMTFGAQAVIIVFFPTVLAAQGFTIANSLFFTMIINIGRLIGATLVSYFAAKLTRKAVLGFVTLAAVGVAMLYSSVGSITLVLLVGALMQLMFILLNTTTWLYAPELYPMRVRAFDTGSCVGVALVGASIIPYLAGSILDAAGVLDLFSMVTVMYLIMAFIVRLMMVETKYKKLEEVSEM